MDGWMDGGWMDVHYYKYQMSLNQMYTLLLYKFSLFPYFSALTY